MNKILGYSLMIGVLAIGGYALNNKAKKMAANIVQEQYEPKLRTVGASDADIKNIANRARKKISTEFFFKVAHENTDSATVVWEKAYDSIANAHGIYAKGIHALKNGAK